ncbi:hypothetical protein K461DRAFT_157902 [Myriangium duriaei CBS 260.36]|uniref:Uncharacterized protein n=1 Tax=Myriangium duriaei CBS 260.36 TaxID=1168546 RepID=A0A9P4MF14_9PEZI|nr:hypothetical protein K461DRAFT_157902 [Myriangium duriaei CBS 260.36]
MHFATILILVTSFGAAVHAAPLPLAENESDASSVAPAPPSSDITKPKVDCPTNTKGLGTSDEEAGFLPLCF